MQFNLFMYCTVGFVSTPHNSLRTAESIATMDDMLGGRIGPDERAVALPST